MVATSSEAAKGFNVCKVCAFENFKASRFCTICGAPIASSEATSDQTNIHGATSTDGRTLDDTLDPAANQRTDSASVTEEGTPSGAVVLIEPLLTSRQIRAKYVYLFLACHRRCRLRQ